MKFNSLAFLLIYVVAMFANGCDVNNAPPTPTSRSGVTQADIRVNTESNGLTVEQNNIIRRLELENVPGTIKHLYVISAYSGQVIVYSTVRGKVTSSGKRLSPYSVAASGQQISHMGIPIDIEGKGYYTSEVLQDDGTYGSSIPYLFWFDSKGVYHQHYVSGGQIIHLSDQPLSVPSIILNME